VANIDPGVTGGKECWAGTADRQEKLPVEDDAVTAWLKSLGPIRPFAVTIPDAQQILGRKARSQIYEAIGRGELEAVKDGSKTLVVVASIVRYCGRMQPAQIKARLKTKKRWPESKTGAKRPKEARALKREEVT
jgi:hypothetical protein